MFINFVNISILKYENVMFKVLGLSKPEGLSCHHMRYAVGEAVFWVGGNVLLKGQVLDG